MTDELIKQNAEEYANTFQNMYGFYERENCIKDFIAGAHSLDGEIEELKKQIERLSQREQMLFDREVELIAENDQLRSPWISVEQRLPPIKIRVLFLDKNGKVWLGRNTIAMQAELETDENNNLLPPPTVPPAKPVITHWMPIPELKKG